MNLSFESRIADAYLGPTQKIRVLSEAWAGREVFCVNCYNNGVARFANNQPAADFHCTRCSEQYELKSQRQAFGRTIADGAYHSMVARVSGNTNPNLLLLNYDLPSLSVTDLFVVPKHFLTADIIEERKPLSPHARRRGWIGCNILLDRIPMVGRISIVKNSMIVPRDDVRDKWKRTLFLRDFRVAEAKGWLLDVIKCIEAIGTPMFRLEQLYAFESDLRKIYPGNAHIKEKIRQQLQVLRDHGFLEFVARGTYRLQG